MKKITAEHAVDILKSFYNMLADIQISGDKAAALYNEEKLSLEDYQNLMTDYTAKKDAINACASRVLKFVE
jgi:hypothetical protein